MSPLYCRESFLCILVVLLSRHTYGSCLSPVMVSTQSCSVKLTHACTGHGDTAVWSSHPMQCIKAVDSSPVNQWSTAIIEDLHALLADCFPPGSQAIFLLNGCHQQPYRWAKHVVQHILSIQAIDLAGQGRYLLMRNPVPQGVAGPGSTK